MKLDIPSLVQENKAYLVQMRRHFHQHPEVSMKEFETCATIQRELDAMGIPHRRVGETGVFGWIDGTANGARENVILRADIDALAMDDLKTVDYASQNPGVCHACGHDSHTATLLAAAKVLVGLRSHFSGTVRLFFQQGEEYGQGARLFVAENLVADCRRVLGVHVTPKLTVGQVALTPGPQCASCDHFLIHITGLGAHASTPHLGVDAAYVAAQTVVALQSIVSRNTNPLDTVLVGVGKIDCGTQYNIVAEHAMLEGTVRALTPETRAFTIQRVKDIVEQTAALYGATAQIEVRDYAAPLVNHPVATQEAVQVAETFLPAQDIVSNFPPALAADDFADFQAVIPGVYAFIGTQNPQNPDTARSLHHGLVDIDEDGLLVACQLYVGFALKTLGTELE